LTERTSELVELAYVVAPKLINLIGDRLEDIPGDLLTGTTLVLRGDTHRLFLACASQEVAERVRMRLREFFETQAREVPGETLEDTLEKGFDRIIPGDAFPVWRDKGWDGGMTPDEAIRWAVERRQAEQADAGSRGKPEATI